MHWHDERHRLSLTVTGIAQAVIARTRSNDPAELIGNDRTMAEWSRDAAAHKIGWFTTARPCRDIGLGGISGLSVQAINVPQGLGRLPNAVTRCRNLVTPRRTASHTGLAQPAVPGSHATPASRLPIVGTYVGTGPLWTRLP